MGLRDDILSDACGWADYVLSGVPPDKILKSRGHASNASKSAKPFLTLQIPDHDNMVGHDELERDRNGGTPRERVIGHRWDLLQADGYGEAAISWLGKLRRTLKRSDVRRWLENNGPMGIDQQGAVTNTSAIEAGDSEERASADFRINYRVKTDWFDVSNSVGIAKKLELRGSDNVLKEYSAQDVADALSLDMTVG